MKFKNFNYFFLVYSSIFVLTVIYHNKIDQSKITRMGVYRIRTSFFLSVDNTLILKFLSLF